MPEIVDLTESPPLSPSRVSLSNEAQIGAVVPNMFAPQRLTGASLGIGGQFLKNHVKGIAANYGGHSGFGGTCWVVTAGGGDDKAVSTGQDTSSMFDKKRHMDAMECGICFEIYGTEGPRVPVSLTCGHTYCRKCLKDCKQTSQGHGERRDFLKCPKCRIPTSKNVEDLPPNYSMLEMLDEFKETKIPKRG